MLSVTMAHMLSLPDQANMLEGGGKTPIFSPLELEEFGYKLVSYPLSLMGVSMRAMQEVDCLRLLKKLSPMHFEVKSSGSGNGNPDGDQLIKLGSKGLTIHLGGNTQQVGQIHRFLADATSWCTNIHTLAVR